MIYSMLSNFLSIGVLSQSWPNFSYHSVFLPSSPLPMESGCVLSILWGLNKVVVESGSSWVIHEDNPQLWEQLLKHRGCGVGRDSSGGKGFLHKHKGYTCVYIPAPMEKIEYGHALHMSVTQALWVMENRDFLGTAGLTLVQGETLSQGRKVGIYRAELFF